jgi:acetyl-CoA C-acetyltransferase
MRIAIVGLGMHPFGRTPGRSGRAQGARAARDALADAGLTWGDIQFAVGGSYSAGDADSLVSDLGLTGVPFINVFNGCATGGSALLTARNWLLSGSADLGIVIGFDKHQRGAFNTDPASIGLGDWYANSGLMLTTQFFALKIRRYQEAYGISGCALAAVAEKAFFNGSLNPNAWRREPHSRHTIASSPMINDPLTQYMFCSPAEGAVALVVTSAELAARYTTTPVYLDAIEMRSRRYGSFEVFSPWLAPQTDNGPSADAAGAAFAAASVAPEDVDVAQLQDTDSGAEIIHMAEAGLCAHGDQEKLVLSGATRIGGTLPVNTDGGCLANGEPIGASGLRQVAENVLQLRGAAGPRQIPNRPRVGFSHVYGSPGVSACTVITR